MKLSEDKISHVSHQMMDGIWKDDLVDFPDEAAALKQCKATLVEYCKMDQEVDQVVRKRLQSYSRNIPEGSREWDVMYRKHFHEEMQKRWR